MAQRRSKPAPQDITPDYLAKPRQQFESELSERIARGEELISRQVNNQSDYSALSTDHSFWHDYNIELISRAFNRVDNQYYKDYDRTLGINLAYMHRTPSFIERVEDLKGDIKTHIDRLKKIKEKLSLIEEVPELKVASQNKELTKQAQGLRYLTTIFSKFHRVAQHLRHRHADRDTLILKDEYDVQDLLHSLLHLHFNDIRAEDYSPSYAGGNSRVDFTLKEEKIVVEVKMTNDHLKDKEVGSQLLIDIGRYRGHPDCEVLAVFVYDKLDNIRNKAGLIADLERMSSPELKVRVFIEPK